MGSCDKVSVSGWFQRTLFSFALVLAKEAMQGPSSLHLSMVGSILAVDQYFLSNFYFSDWSNSICCNSICCLCRHGSTLAWRKIIYYECVWFTFSFFVSTSYFYFLKIIFIFKRLEFWKYVWIDFLFSVFIK